MARRDGIAWQRRVVAWGVGAVVVVCRRLEAKKREQVGAEIQPRTAGQKRKDTLVMAQVGL